MDTPLDAVTDAIFAHPHFNSEEYDLGKLTGQWSSLMEYGTYLDAIDRIRSQEMGVWHNE